MRSLIIRLLRVAPQTAHPRQPLFILLGLIFSALAPQAMAATINVTASATDTLNGANGQCSLREAITNINNATTTYADCAPTGAYGTGDTINIPAGTYTTAIAGMGEDLNAIGDLDIRKSVAIVGAGAGTTTINGNRMGAVFDIRSVTVSISGVTVTGGWLAGISSNGTLIIDNSTIRGNEGSGIINSGGSLAVTNSTISENSDSYSGGGGIFSSGTLSIADSTISRNSTTSVGGGIAGGGTLIVTNSTISGNTAVNGGGISHLQGTLTVTHSTISGNTVTAGQGGGIYSSSYSIPANSVTNSTISGNTASGAGGGIFCFQMTVTNSTISGNTGHSDSNGGAGGISTNGTVSIDSATIIGNIGGGISNYGRYTSTMYLRTKNSIVDSCGISTISDGFNLENGTSCGFTGPGDKQNTNPLLGALADNGGPTQTMALLPGSPAIDAGLCVHGADQRGATRPQGAGCDIGAFEVGTIKADQTIEFYHAEIDHYFMTASSDEAVALDNKPSWGWVRTGKTFNVWQTRATAPGNASPVCRFFGVFANGTVGSHFYTVDAAECDMVKGRLDWGWGYENDAFYAVNPAGGSCPAGTSPVYRVFNNGMGGAPNHRYMANQTDVSAMVSQGWVSEGIAFCGAQ